MFLLGESHEQRSLVGYSPWGHKKLATTEQLSAGAFIYCPKRFSTVLPHLIFTRTTSDRYHYYFHFLDEEIEAMVQICIANK